MAKILNRRNGDEKQESNAVNRSNRSTREMR